MFDDIGEKIKGLAVAVCVIGIIASVIGGFIFLGETFLLGIIIIILGSLFSWVGSFALYGFGELISQTSAINYRITKIEEKLNSKQGGGISMRIDTKESYSVKSRPYMGEGHYNKPTSSFLTNESKGWTCLYCFAKNPSDVQKCRSCGSPRG